MKTLIFDTETTGLIANRVQNLSKQPHIIEFYGQVINNAGEVSEALEFRCKPPIAIPEKSSSINGIYDGDVAECEPFNFYLRPLMKIFDSVEAICAHNLSFDCAILTIEIARSDMPRTPFRKLQICTVERTEHIKGYRLSLAALYNLLFGEDFKGAHSAKGDVTALTRCFVELRKRGEI